MGMATDYASQKFQATSDVAGQLLQLNLAASTQYIIVDGSATSLFTVACPTGAMVGGAFLFLVRASDATDFQAMSGLVTFAAVNKAGTHTTAITDLSTVDAKAVSSGTLTLSWSFVTGTNLCTVKLTPTGSLTETTYTVQVTVLPGSGIVTFV